VIAFREIDDADPAIAFSPLVRGIEKTLAWVGGHGACSPKVSVDGRIDSLVKMNSMSYSNITRELDGNHTRGPHPTKTLNRNV
jgi:hypothetical protein